MMYWIIHRGMKVVVKMVNFHDLILFFNSDLSDWHCNDLICLKIQFYFLFC